MYSIKIMSPENMPDADVGKGFKMILVDAGDTFEFGHNDQGEPIVTVTTFASDDRTGSSIEYPVTGNAYVMSETGKTVASFWGRNKQTVHVTIDERDPDPEFTVALIQAAFQSRDCLNATDAIDDSTDVTKYTPEQRCKIYRTRVATRMSNGATQVEAMTAEARWIQ